jgi:hypothetical protein
MTGLHWISFKQTTNTRKDSMEEEPKKPIVMTLKSPQIMDLINSFNAAQAEFKMRLERIESLLNIKDAGK